MKGFYREVIYKYTLKNVNLRAEPSKTAEVLNVIPQGSKVKVIDMEDEWTELSVKLL
ncbi:SH3 domain-containing protein [uncultured Clostridium sp.]|uniref:SH3 domain-containing protein n=1 Tax=uncultured Clostridium sp. TaxID=59620 RepID=UPI0025E443DD|nr:SH3 domain-containing protein [uncultured Clostridium sp.]